MCIYLIKAPFDSLFRLSYAYTISPVFLPEPFLPDLVLMPYILAYFPNEGPDLIPWNLRSPLDRAGIVSFLNENLLPLKPFDLALGMLNKILSNNN